MRRDKASPRKGAEFSDKAMGLGIGIVSIIQNPRSFETLAAQAPQDEGFRAVYDEVRTFGKSVARASDAFPVGSGAEGAAGS